MSELENRIVKILKDKKLNKFLNEINHSLDFEENLESNLFGAAYVFSFPSEKEKRIIIEEIIINYAKKNGLHFIVRKKFYCKGIWECTGHYANPLKRANLAKTLFIDSFPSRLKRCAVHFLGEENYKKYLSYLKLSLKNFMDIPQKNI